MYARGACLLVLALSAISSVQADSSLRCGHDFVDIGDSKYQILEVCGEPEFRDVISGEESPEIEQWGYESEWSAFNRLLTFVGGRLRKIERFDE